MRILLLVSAAIVSSAISQNAEFNKELEKDLLKDYNRRHRPVKKESTSVQVGVYLSISHIEKVNEHEQTLLVHGHMWTSWMDEYLTWKPEKYNGTSRLNIDSWKIWQPALSLYNSAKGNSWHLYMHGLPAMISNNGKVWASGSFSFHVTCLFDFSNWPYDEQECPIVIADWVYDLSRVNLSDPNGDNPWNKPTVRLNYDPLKLEDKKHVAGWEVMDTYRKHCYWGPSGCKQELPEGQPEWYWSLLEFGIKIRRHAPYFGLTVVLPTLATSILTLGSFWVDTPSMSVALLVFNVLLQGLFGWDLIRDLPPGSGSVPKIVSLYGMNLSLTAIAFVVHVMIQYLEAVLPEDTSLPFVQLSSLPAKIRSSHLFQSKGLSFDPQMLLNGDSFDDAKEYNSPLPTVGSAVSLSSALSDDVRMEQPEQSLVDIEPDTKEQKRETEIKLEMTDAEQGTSSEAPTPLAASAQRTLSVQLYFARRVLFCLYALMYGIALPYCLI